MLATFSNKESLALERELTIYQSLFQENEGDFYSNLSDFLNSVSYEALRGFSSRKNTKKSVMHLLFEKFDDEKSKIPNYQVFKRAFPKMTMAMDGMKTIKKNSLAIALQQLESSLVLDVLTMVASKKYPEAPIFTIHDAILTTEEWADQIKDLVVEEMSGIIGLTPRVSTKILSTDALLENAFYNPESELNLIKEKSRGSKLSFGKEYRPFHLLTGEVPNWKGNQVMTIAVWVQVMNDPKYQPMLVKFASDEQLSLKVVTEKPVLAFFQSEVPQGRGTTQSMKKGYVVPPKFKFEKVE